MTTTPTTKELLGGAAAGVKFEAPGDAIEGTLINFTVKAVTKMGTGEVDTFPSGDPKYQFILTLQTNLRDDVDDDGKRTLYAKSHLFIAVKQAVAATGAEDFEKGGWIQAIFTGYGEAQKGFNPPKMFVVQYKRPTAQMIAQQSQGDPQQHAQAVSNVQAQLGGQPVQQQPPVQPTYGQQQAPPYGQQAPQYPNGQPAPQAIPPTGVQGYVPPQQPVQQQPLPQDVPNVSQIAAQIAAVRSGGMDPAVVFANSPAHLAQLAQLG